MPLRPPIRSFRDIERKLRRDTPVVTLFSGGLDSAYLLLWLRDNGFTDVHAVSIDLAESETSDQKTEIAGMLGAKLHILDCQEEFARDFVAPAISAQAVYLDLHPVSSTLSRPLIAQRAAELADRLGAHAVLHTANRSQNTLRRLNGALHLLNYPGLHGSPYDLEPVDRDDKQAALAQAGVELLKGRSVSGDSNLWCREFESGILDDPERHRVPDELFRWSAVRPGVAPSEISVGIESGIPVTVDGRPMELVELIAELNGRVGAYGIGRYSGLEHLDNGEKVLELREMPAAWILLRSYRHIEAACLDAELLREKQHLEQVWVREALEGRWFGDLRRAVQTFMDTCAQRTTGTVTWELRAGGADTRSIVAPHPLYLRDRERWEEQSIAAESSAHALLDPATA
ncbi:argininosuccinate synthase-related protein [Streptomyces sp. CT34]|uniref:argininosuccinate synthase-related protein n=1 Tax=Streptomyces sp. CT34 TaxID=1553907 RepID=UPI0005BCC507|nr:argininosuccinate synthase-related protein [Streptomyces sp. CT34]